MGNVTQGFFCSSTGIINSIYGSLLADVTMDSSLPIVLVRFLHNKPLYFFLLSFRCYFQFFDPYILASITTPFILPLIYFGIISLSKKKIFLIIILLFPFLIILFLRNLITDIYLILKIYYYFVAVYGPILIVKNKLLT